MLRTVVAILVVLWLLGFLAFHVGPLIHLIIVLALVIFIFDLLAGRNRTVV